MVRNRSRREAEKHARAQLDISGKSVDVADTTMPHPTHARAHCDRSHRYATRQCGPRRRPRTVGTWTRERLAPVVQVCEPPIASFEASERPSTQTVPIPIWRSDEHALVAVAVGAKAAVPLSEGRNHEMATRHRACGDQRGPTPSRQSNTTLLRFSARSSHLTPRQRRCMAH